MTTVLLTGFEPFDGAATNPSWDAVLLLAERWTGAERLVVERLPVAFATCAPALRAAVERHAPDLVIATGLAEGRTGITPERVAINVDDARIPDNAGAQPIDEPIEPAGPAARFSGLPIKRIVAALDEAGLPASVSSTAGTFTCNHVFYALMGLAEERPGLRGGFVHVPAAEGTARDGMPALPLERIAEGLGIAVRTALEHGADLRAVGGSEH